MVWTLNTAEIHSVTFTGTCEDLSCVPACLSTADVSPCGSPSYDGVSALDSSGRMVPAGYNWDNSVPHGGTTYALTFTRPGVNVYFDLSVPGMRGVVVVHPAGTPYPFTPDQYTAQAREQLQADLAAGASAGDAAAASAGTGAAPVTVSAGPGGSGGPSGSGGAGAARTYHVGLGASSPQTARVTLGPAGGSAAAGSARLDEPGAGSSPAPSITITVRLSGLPPGSVHAVQILPGVCGAPAPTTGLVLSNLFVPPAFTLNDVTAGADGTASVTTVLTGSPGANGPGLLRIPGAGWFINVAAGATADNGSTSDACGNVVFRDASVMRYLPRDVRVHVGDTVAWAGGTSDEIHGVTFLAGQALPSLPAWYVSGPTGNAAGYNGSGFLDSGPLYVADASGRNHTFAVTFTTAGTFGYVDVGDTVLGMQGSVTVLPRD